jgi:hypothetical protein
MEVKLWVVKSVQKEFVDVQRMTKKRMVNEDED